MSICVSRQQVLKARRAREHEGEIRPEITDAERVLVSKRLKRRRKEKKMNGKYPKNKKQKWMP